MVAMALAVNAKDYTDQLIVSSNGTEAPAQETTISVNEQENGKYTFTLKDFTLENMINVGTIEVSDIETSDEDGIRSFSVSKEITIQEGSEGVEWGMVGMSMPIELTGKMTDEKLYAVIKINFMNTLQIEVTFGDDNFPKAYTDNLTVTFMGDTSAPQPTTIFVETQADGKYTLSLKNFKFGTMGVGNVVLTDVEGTDNGGVVNLSAEQTIKITEGDDPDVTTWLGPILGDVPVSLKAKMSEDKLYAEITINMMGGINVVFGTDDFTTGIDHVTTTPDNGVEAIYDLSGRRLNEMQKGINIVRKADGTTVKVLKK